MIATKTIIINFITINIDIANMIIANIIVIIIGNVVIINTITMLMTVVEIAYLTANQPRHHHRHRPCQDHQPL